jgi:zinc protease
VTPEDVARVAGRYLLRSNRTSGLYVPTPEPERATIPETPIVADLVKDYKGGKAIAAGETFDPTPENIEKRTQRVKLPSGVKAVLLPKKTRDEAVILRLALRYGNEESLKGFTTAADFMGEVMRRGTKDMTRQQLDDAFDKLKASVSVSGTTGQVNVNIQARRKTLPEVLTLLGKVLREPNFPAEELDVLKRQQLESLQRELTDPIGLARRAMLRKAMPYDKDDVRYMPNTQEEIDRLKGLTVEKLRHLYADQLSGSTASWPSSATSTPMPSPSRWAICSRTGRARPLTATSPGKPSPRSRASAWPSTPRTSRTRSTWRPRRSR